MKANASSSDGLKLTYNATPIANIADNASVSPLVSIFIAGHSADPGAAGDQTTSEIAYTGYARATVARTTGGFTVATPASGGASVALVSSASLGACTAGSGTMTHFSTGVAVSGVSKVLHRGVFGSRQGPFTGAITGNALTIPGAGANFAVNDRIAFYAVNNSTLPTGIAEGTVYFVLTVTGDVLTVSATQGGAAIGISVAGDGMAYRVTPISITAGITPQLTGGVIFTVEE